MTQPLSTQREVGAAVVKAGLEAGSLQLDGVKPPTKLGTFDTPVGGQVDESFLLLFQLLELFVQMLMQLAGQGLLVGHRCVQVPSDRHCKLLWDLACLMVATNCGFDLIGGQVWQVADSVLAAAAEKVLVTLAATALGFGVDESAGTASFLAATAEQNAFEIVL
ncbi:MAG: hypothetical protein QOG53_1387 [Frankiales bacterium]|nr:hypothetical protein [Frankiales bacterium]